MIQKLRQLRRYLSPYERHWRLYQKCVHSHGLSKKILVNRVARIQHRFGSEIPVTANISPFYAPHQLYGIFISIGATIGRDCTIFQGVTIGSNTIPNSKHQGAPILGDHVFVGAGAKIIGGVTIGDYARIGAGCVVTQDIPANATVVLPAPQIICHDAPRSNKFLGHQEWLASR